jgi:ketosteroid isomerase-like protein
MQSSMSATPQTLEIVQSAYAAFGRGDIPAILDLIADEIEWKFVGSKGLPYTGTFRTKDAIANWFASIPKVEEILIFEHREFISAGESVTVLGWERSRGAPRRKGIRNRLGSRFHGARRSHNALPGHVRFEASAAARA